MAVQRELQRELRKGLKGLVKRKVADWAVHSCACWIAVATRLN